jgi:hypothetical protein
MSCSRSAGSSFFDFLERFVGGITSSGGGTGVPGGRFGRLAAVGAVPGLGTGPTGDRTGVVVPGKGGAVGLGLPGRLGGSNRTSGGTPGATASIWYDWT